MIVWIFVLIVIFQASIWLFEAISREYIKTINLIKRRASFFPNVQSWKHFFHLKISSKKKRNKVN